MISPHTPPGTALVVVWLPQSAADIQALIHDHCFVSRFGKVTTLHIGQRVVLEQVQPCEVSRVGYDATLVGIQGCWFLKCFKVAELPRSITSLLATKPADQLEDA